MTALHQTFYIKERARLNSKPNTTKDTVKYLLSLCFTINKQPKNPLFLQKAFVYCSRRRHTSRA